MIRGHRIGAQSCRLHDSRAGDADATEELNFVPRCVNQFTSAPPSSASSYGQRNQTMPKLPEWLTDDLVIITLCWGLGFSIAIIGTAFWIAP